MSGGGGEENKSMRPVMVVLQDLPSMRIFQHGQRHVHRLLSTSGTTSSEINVRILHTCMTHGTPSYPWQ